jgi:hypothetical protein
MKKQLNMQAMVAKYRLSLPQVVNTLQEHGIVRGYRADVWLQEDAKEWRRMLGRPDIDPDVLKVLARKVRKARRNGSYLLKPLEKTSQRHLPKASLYGLTGEMFDTVYLRTVPKVAVGLDGFLDENKEQLRNAILEVMQAERVAKELGHKVANTELDLIQIWMESRRKSDRIKGRPLRKNDRGKGRATASPN